MLVAVKVSLTLVIAFGALWLIASVIDDNHERVYNWGRSLAVVAGVPWLASVAITIILMVWLVA